MLVSSVEAFADVNLIMETSVRRSCCEVTVSARGPRQASRSCRPDHSLLFV